MWFPRENHKLCDTLCPFSSRNSLKHSVFHSQCTWDWCRKDSWGTNNFFLLVVQGTWRLGPARPLRPWGAKLEGPLEPLMEGSLWLVQSLASSASPPSSDAKIAQGTLACQQHRWGARLGYTSMTWQVQSSLMIQRWLFRKGGQELILESLKLPNAVHTWLVLNPCLRLGSHTHTHTHTHAHTHTHKRSPCHPLCFALAASFMRAHVQTQIISLSSLCFPHQWVRVFIKLLCLQ